MNTMKNVSTLDVTVSVPVDQIEAFNATVREFHFGKTEHHAAIRARQNDREQGLASLRHLYDVAQGHSGQCRYIAAFLLGLYNGGRFPFDLTDLRCIDHDLFEHCIAVLRMDRQPQQEVHCYFEHGGQKWERMGRNWRMVDVEALRHAAKRLAENAGSSGPHAEAASKVLCILQGNR
jgi:hypothetical protein